MKRKRLSLWWAVVGDDLLDIESGEARKEIGRFLSMLVRYQERAEIPQYWVRVLETSSGLHGNLIFPGTERIASSLHHAFPQYMCSSGAIQPVGDAYGLVAYLSKERTSEATRALGLNGGSRLRGSHRLEGDGDRVSLSRALKRDTIAADAVQPWQATNAKRAPYRSTARPVLSIVASMAQIAPERALKATGQLFLFPELEKPVARLKAFTGGILSPSAALELEYRRRGRGLSQRQLAGLVGLSQSHYANVARGHDRMSRYTARRLKEALLNDNRVTRAA